MCGNFFQVIGSSGLILPDSEVLGLLSERGVTPERKHQAQLAVYACALTPARSPRKMAGCD